MQRKCTRCNELECICGDVAFESWVETELLAQFHNLQHDITNHGQAPQFETTNQLAAVAAMTEKR